LHINELQTAIRNRDYQPQLAHGYFLKLVEEVGELAEAIRKGSKRHSDSIEIKGTIDEELFDVMYYVLALANVYDINMEEAVILKEQVNLTRVEYRNREK